MDGASDEDLMRHVMNGDRHALSTLVERHYDTIRSYLARLLQGNHTLAEDLAQEAFLVVLRQQSYRADRAFLPWLYTIATNLARDYFKSATARHTTLVPEASWQALIDTAPNPEATIEAAEQSQQIACAIGRLAEEYQTVIILRYYQGLSLNAIAEVLDIPIGTVKSRLSVGTHRLRALLTITLKGAYR